MLFRSRDLAVRILDGVVGSSCLIPMDEVTSVMEARWGGRVKFSGLGQFEACDLVSNQFFWSPISATEVSENLRRMKSSSAPGPDEVTKQDLVKWDRAGSRLARLFTAWLVSGVLPKAFKENTTTLIPKSTDPAALL